MEKQTSNDIKTTFFFGEVALVSAAKRCFLQMRCCLRGLRRSSAATSWDIPVKCTGSMHSGAILYYIMLCYSAGLKHRMTFWKSPGVSEKLPFRRAGPKSHVFELFFRLENLEWVTEMLRNTAPVSQNRSGTRNIEWVFAHSWHTADFQKQFGHNSKSTRHSKFGSQVLFFVEGSPKSFENDFFEHLLFIFFICYSLPRIFPAVFHPFFIHIQIYK